MLSAFPLKQGPIAWRSLHCAYLGPLATVRYIEVAVPAPDTRSSRPSSCSATPCTTPTPSHKLNNFGNTTHLAGLLYQSGGRGIQETRTGAPLFSGSPAALTEWKFKALRENAFEKIADEKVRDEKLCDFTPEDALKITMTLPRRSRWTLARTSRLAPADSTS